jgi:hypothetical protein
MSKRTHHFVTNILSALGIVPLIPLASLFCRFCTIIAFCFFYGINSFHSALWDIYTAAFNSFAFVSSLHWRSGSGHTVFVRTLICNIILYLFQSLLFRMCSYTFRAVIFVNVSHRPALRCS